MTHNRLYIFINIRTDVWRYTLCQEKSTNRSTDHIMCSYRRLLRSIRQNMCVRCDNILHRTKLRHDSHQSAQRERYMSVLTSGDCKKAANTFWWRSRNTSSCACIARDHETMRQEHHSELNLLEEIAVWCAQTTEDSFAMIARDVYLLFRLRHCSDNHSVLQNITGQTINCDLTSQSMYFLAIFTALRFM